MKKKKILTKILLGALAILWITIASFGYSQINGGSTTLKTIKIGYQKADPIDIAKTRGKFIKKMKSKGYQVVFKEFKDGSSLLQALKTGNVDYARTGDVPPVTAQSNGTNLIYVAAGASKAKGSGILVKKNSSISSIKDLKGKKIAYTKNTSSEYLLMKVLKSAGLTTNDVTLVNMDQSSAGVSFAKSKVDAWVTWDPYTAQGEIKSGGKMLVDGENLTNNRDFIISTKKFTDKHQKATDYLIKYLNQDMQWAQTHKNTVAKMLSKSLNMSESVIKKQVTRRSFSMQKLSKSMIAEQQKLGDFYYEEGLMDKKVDVSKNVLK